MLRKISLGACWPVVHACVVFSPLYSESIVAFRLLIYLTTLLDLTARTKKTVCCSYLVHDWYLPTLVMRINALPIIYKRTRTSSRLRVSYCNSSLRCTWLTAVIAWLAHSLRTDWSQYAVRDKMSRARRVQLKNEHFVLLLGRSWLINVKLWS